MKERPILFNSEMVRAILEGRKTQTMRVVKGKTIVQKENLQKAHGFGFDEGIGQWSAQMHGQFIDEGFSCPHGKPGDHLWVRETWGIGQQCKDGPDYWYRATEERSAPRWRPSIHMPRKASRIQLEITNVRVERLQSISEKDAEAEGINYFRNETNSYGWGPCEEPAPEGAGYLRKWAFKQLWDSINEKRGFGWDTNPWVWVIEFKRIRP